jgi:general secretion pathway protein G
MELPSVRPTPTLSRLSPQPVMDDGEAGFTLLEILVVIAILGLLIGLVAPAVLRQLGGARQSIARQSIERLGAVLDLYKLDIGSYPSTEDGLQALVTRPAGVYNWNGPYLQGNGAPVDAWTHPYTYRVPSQRSGHDYDLCSAGADPSAGASSQICNP